MLNDVRGRGRAMVVWLLAAWSLMLFAVFTSLCNHLLREWFGLVVGGVLALLALLTYLLGAHFLPAYLATFLLNTVAIGFCAGAYYGVTGVSAGLADLLPATLLPLALLLISALLLAAFPGSKDPIVALTVLLEIGLIVASIVFWVRNGGDFYAFSLFSHLVALFYTVVYGLTACAEERLLLKDVAIGSFGAFVLVGIAGLLAICAAGGGDCDCDCDGGCCDSCDCTGCDCSTGSSGKKTKINPPDR